MSIKAESATTLVADGQEYRIYSLAKAAEKFGNIDRLPYSLKVLLENQLRHFDNDTVTEADIQALVDWQKTGQSDREIAYRPARVLMQDFTGVPGVVDLAAMRAAVTALGDDPEKVNPLSPVDLVIDHSVMVDQHASSSSFKNNVQQEMARNGERYTFLRWGQQAFNNFQVVPPGTGICHQVNLEYLGQTIWTSEVDGVVEAYPDTLVGTDSHTTMINGLGVLGWGVGGIEAEAAMLGQPVSMLIPEVVGFKLTGKLKEGVTATDLVLNVTEILRKAGVVGKFVEFFGDGLADLPLADRATIANMAPEYGATCGFFPVDQITLDYLRLTGRDAATVARVEAYCKAQGLWLQPGHEPVFSQTLEFDMGTVEPSMAGPKRPQDRVTLPQVSQAFAKFMDDQANTIAAGDNTAVATRAGVATFSLNGIQHELKDGAVTIAAITSCTNTSNPSVMMAAGLLAKKAVAKGLQRQPWVKSSLAPGSKVVTEYLDAADLTQWLDQLGFNLVGYGCTTCIGNSGPLHESIEQAITEADLTVASVLSGNRNFEGRVHPLVKTNWLASPPLVVAYALAGSVKLDLTKDPLGIGSDGEAVYLKDIWPSNQEIAEAEAKVRTDMFRSQYSAVTDGDSEWQAVEFPKGQTYAWPDSTYIQHPPYFEGMGRTPEPIADIIGARPLAILADSVTTDHISPAGSIKVDSPAGHYLKSLGVEPKDFNSYGSRRGNHEVMMRGTFANVRIRNEMVPGVEGGYTRYVPTGEQMAIYDAAMRYQADKTPTAIIAGKEYGTGSSRDWAAKGTNLLGVRVVLTESYERIHRSNLVGMGVLPLQFAAGDDRHSLGFKGDETLTVRNLQTLQPGQDVPVEITYGDGRQVTIMTKCRIDTGNELEYFRHGGILQYVLRRMIGAA